MLLRTQATVSSTTTPFAARCLPSRSRPTAVAAATAGARRPLASTLTPFRRRRLVGVSNNAAVAAVSANSSTGNGDAGESRARPLDSQRPLRASPVPSASLIEQLKRRGGMVGALKKNNDDTTSTTTTTKTEIETAAKLKPIVSTNKFTSLAARCVAFALVLVMVRVRYE